MSAKLELTALIREFLGNDAAPRGVAIRTETPNMLRVSEVAALASARALQEIAGQQAVPRAWLLHFVRRVLPVLEEGYQNCGEDPECSWAEPMMEARAIVAALDGADEGKNRDGQN